MIAIRERCRRDIVVDTNVFGHADNSGERRHAASLALLVWLREADTVRLVLDHQGKSEPDPEKTSVLYMEYRDTLSPQGLGAALVSHLLATAERHRFVPRPSHQVSEQIRALVPRNKRDRAVLGAAAGSLDRLLASNDLTDFRFCKYNTCTAYSTGFLGFFVKGPEFFHIKF